MQESRDTSTCPALRLRALLRHDHHLFHELTLPVYQLRSLGKLYVLPNICSVRLALLYHLPGCLLLSDCASSHGGVHVGRFFLWVLQVCKHSTMEPASNAVTTRAPTKCPAPSADINAELARPPVQAPSPARSSTVQPMAAPSSKPEVGAILRLKLFHRIDKRPARQVCLCNCEQAALSALHVLGACL
jgi:hypothetical protein